MAQSLSKVIIHIIFSTKNRERTITPDITQKLHAYLATACRDQDCQAYRVGGVTDHVHLAVRLGRTITQSRLLEEIKRGSSKWTKTQGPQHSGFSWQKGFGCFSISPGHLDKLITYIDRQEEHHKTISFKDEFRSLCQKYSVDFDERYCRD